MKFRFTNYELEKKSDQFMVTAILNERLSTLNYANPLFKRLSKIRDKISRNETLTANFPEDFKDEQGR